MRETSRTVRLNFIVRFARRALLAVAAAAGVSLAVPAGAQTVFGTNTGTFADYLDTYAMQSLPLRGFSTAANNLAHNYNPDPTVMGANGSVIADFGTVTYAQNYPSGNYVIQFDSPAPVTINPTGFIGQPTGVTRVGTHETMNVTITHDNGNPLAGLGFLTSSGVSASNPVSNFTISQQGTTPSALTNTFLGMTSKYQGTRWMNNLSINNNTTPMTSASLVPSGFNQGRNSYQDIVNWTNQQSMQKTVMIEIPVNADNSFIAGVAKTMSGLSAGKQLVVEYGNEVWNYGFTQAGWLASQSDSRVTASDSFTRSAQEGGLKAANMMQVFKANYTGAVTLNGYLGSQGSNTYFVDQEKAIIDKTFGAGTVKNLFQYQGIGFYPGDGLTTGASSAQDLFNKQEADLGRNIGYLQADVADAKASGLKELVYEWSPNGYLTRGSVSQSVIDAFRADPLSKQLTTDTWNAINSNIGTGGIAFDFDVTGDGWSTQINPAVASEYEQQAINQISASVGVGTAPLAPEPTSIGLALLGGSALLARRRSPRKA